MKRLVLVAAVLFAAGGWLAHAGEVCTEERADGGLDSTGHCRCTCKAGDEGGWGCVWITQDGGFIGGDDWCPQR